MSETLELNDIVDAVVESATRTRRAGSFKEAVLWIANNTDVSELTTENVPDIVRMTAQVFKRSEVETVQAVLKAHG